MTTVANETNYLLTIIVIKWYTRVNPQTRWIHYCLFTVYVIIIYLNALLYYVACADLSDSVAMRVLYRYLSNRECDIARESEKNNI